MLEWKELCAGYEKREVLHGITACLEAGTVTVLTGPNGCGKSTLLKTTLGLSSKYSGEIWLDGKPIEKYRPGALARKIAYLSQNRKVPDLTVQRMVLHGRFPYLSYPRRYRKQDFEMADWALEQMGMEAYAQQNMNRLSGGMQQKVYIAMALAQDTPMIFMDEPTSFLDLSHQKKLTEIVSMLAERGKTMVLILHDLSMALHVADQILVLKEGTLKGKGSPEEVYTSGVLDEVFGVNLKRVSTEDGWQYYYK